MVSIDLKSEDQLMLWFPDNFAGQNTFNSTIPVVIGWIRLSHDNLIHTQSLE